MIKCMKDRDRKLRTPVGRKRVIHMSLTTLIVLIGCALTLVACGSSKPQETDQYSPPQGSVPSPQPSAVPPPASSPQLSGSYYTTTMAGEWILTFTGDKVISQSGLGFGTYKYKIAPDGRRMELQTIFSDDPSLSALCGTCTGDFSYDQDTDTFRFLDYTFIKYKEGE